MENTTATAFEDGNSSVGGVSGPSVDALTLTLVGTEGLICLFGLLGNVLVIYVISGSSLKSQTVTTNTFILNLSISQPNTLRYRINLLFFYCTAG